MRTTTRDVTVDYLANIGRATPVTIPAGTRVAQITDGMGRKHWAVDDVPLLIRLTGNTHDPKYRYCVVPDHAVEG